MTKSLDDACKRLQTVAGALDVVKFAPEYAKEHMTENPFAVSYPREGEMDSEEVPATKGLHTIFTELHFSTTVLEITLPMAIPAVEAFAKAILADPTLNGTVDTVVGPVKYAFGRLDWGGKKENHVGVRFMTTVKIRATS